MSKLVARLFVALAVAAVSVAAEGGALPRPVECNGFTFWRDVPYGDRADLPDEGDGFRGRTGDWRSSFAPAKICRHCTGQRMDLYVPKSAKKGAPSPVALFVHGGTWSHCFDKGAIQTALFRAFMKEGVVLASPDYILQTDNTMNVTAGHRPEATFAEMLRDIDKAVSRLASLLPECGVKASSFAITGESAGAHLALLYAYDQDAPEILGLGLKHEIRFDRAIDIAGPTDLSLFDDSTAEPTETLKKKDPRRAVRALVKRLVGVADDAPDAEVRPLAAKWSPVGLATPRSVPTYMAYGRLLPLVRTDGVIPIAQMEALENALRAAGVVCETKEFSKADHGKVAVRGADWIAGKAAGK